MVASPSQTMERRYGSLPAHLSACLAAMEPSRDGAMIYYPCRAILEGEFAVDGVYVAAEGTYFRHWGIFPEDDKGKNWIPIELVERLEESPLRLPARIANEIYRWGPTGLGYFAFTVLFSDGSQQTCVTGSAVDFIQYPAGKGAADVAGVTQCEGKRERGMMRSPKYFWSLYSE